MQRNLVDWYPPAKFKVSSKELFRRTAIVVEIDEKFRGKLHKKLGKRILPSDYWDFIPIDEEQEENSLKPNRRVLTHAQVLYLISFYFARMLALLFFIFLSDIFV